MLFSFIPVLVCVCMCVFVHVSLPLFIAVMSICLHHNCNNNSMISFQIYYHSFIDRFIKHTPIINTTLEHFSAEASVLSANSAENIIFYRTLHWASITISCHMKQNNPNSLVEDLSWTYSYNGKSGRFSVA